MISINFAIFVALSEKKKFVIEMMKKSKRLNINLISTKGK